MKSLEEIIQKNSEERKNFSSKRATVSLISGIITDAKDFLDNLSNKLISVITRNSYRVEVENQIKFPKIQNIDGEVSIKDMRTLVLGLNEVIKALNDVKKISEKNTKQISKDLKPEKIDFSSLEKAIKMIKFPDIKIPEQKESIEVSNFSEIKKYFEMLEKKLVFPKQEINIPPFPKEMKISNFPKQEKEKVEEDTIGFYWKKDENGQVTEIVDQYPSGNVISTGWSIGRVKIIDERKK